MISVWEEIMRRMNKKIIAIICSACLLLCMCVPAFAAFPKVDHSRKGSISVVMHDSEKDVAVPGGTLTLYQVADIEKNDDNNDVFVLNQTFAESQVPLDNLDSIVLIDELERYVAQKQLGGIVRQIDTNGKVVFEDLPLGLYLIIQETPADGYNKVKSFLVSVPQMLSDEYVYDVDASPKVEVSPVPVVPDNPTPDNPTPEKPKTEKPVTSTGVKLPQTGQLNWPIPVLAACGAVCVIIGGCLRRKSDSVK